MNSEQMLSMILPVTSQVKEDPLCRYVEKVLDEIGRMTDYYEVILVTDRTELAASAAVLSLLERRAGIRILFLSRARYVDEMIMAGFSSAIGDCVLILTPPLDPPSLIPEFVRKVQKGIIAVGVRRSVASESVAYRVLRWAFYLLTNRILELNIPLDTTYLSGYPRFAAIRISQSTDRVRLLKVVTSQIGWPIEYIDYKFENEPDLSYRSLSESLRLSIQLICSVTVKPLLWSGIATAFSALATLAILLLHDFVHVGTPSTELGAGLISVVLIGLSFALLLLYASHYLWSINRSPAFIVRNELCSASMLPPNIKPNIVDRTV